MQDTSAPPVLMSQDNLDQVLVSRLIEAPPEQYPLQPFNYLLGCYERASQELRHIPASADPQAQQQLRALVLSCREQLVSYAALLLAGSGIIPEVRRG